MKYCFNCGFQLEDDAMFCNACGAEQEYEESTEHKEKEVLEARKHLSGYFWNIVHYPNLNDTARKKVFRQTIVGGLVVLLLIMAFSVIITLLMI